MGRGKEEEKISGPMFPRLHVNDTEKGGPRAPPRNKMALYEQLSIPSQRFHPSNLAPPGSSSQGSGLERNLPFSGHFSQSMPAHQSEKLPVTHFNRGSLDTSLAQLEKKQRPREEDDFTVPVFIQSGVGQNHSKVANHPVHPGHAMQSQNLTDCDPKLVRAAALSISANKREQSDQNKEHASPRDFSVSSSTNLPAKENKVGSNIELHGSLNQNCQDLNVDNLTRSEFSDVPLQQRPVSDLLLSDTGHSISAGKLIKDSAKRKMSHPSSISVSLQVHSRLNQPENASDCHIHDTVALLQPENADQCHDISETSVVDSVSMFDISPDDVVKRIGQKHFWKARRVIVNQQRVFAVQVFELHRLIKVQQLIAGYPDVLLEDSIINPSNKCSLGKKLSPSRIGMPTSDVIKCNGDSQKSNQKIESSAENAVSKTTPVRKDGDVASPHLANSPAVTLPTDPKLYRWSFPHPLGHQWLVPIMSATEGLVYKPYAVPGFVEQASGGCGNLGAPPSTGHMMNQPYGFPASHHHHHHHHHAVGVPHDTSRAYFSPNGLPVMNGASTGSVVEQKNHRTEHGSNGQASQLSTGANFSLHQQSSKDMPSQKSGGMPQVAKVLASKDADLLGSTASSPSGRGQEHRAIRAAEGRHDAHPSPLLPASSEGAQRWETAQLTKVIKVVPHNRRSANESAARIFQSIQEERKQYELT